MSKLDDYSEIMTSAPFDVQVQYMDDDELLSRLVACWHLVQDYRRRMEHEFAEREIEPYTIMREEVLRRMTVNGTQAKYAERD